MKKLVTILLSLALALLGASALAEGDSPVLDAEQLDAIFTQMLSGLIDFSRYEQGYSELTSDYSLEKPINKAEVDGVTFELGMSFEEVLAAGMTAPDGFADEEGHERLSTLADFRTEAGNKVELGFSVANEGDKLSNGTMGRIRRYAFYKNNAADVVIEGISVGSDISTLIGTLGSPTRISLNGQYLSLKYEFKDGNVYDALWFWINVDGKVAGLGVEGD